MPKNSRYGDDDGGDPAADNDRVGDLVAAPDEHTTVEKSDGVSLDGFDISKSESDTDVTSIEEGYKGITDGIYPTPARGSGSATGRSESVDVGRSRTGRRDAGNDTVSKDDPGGDLSDNLYPDGETADDDGDDLSDAEFADKVSEVAAAATDEDARDVLEVVRDYVDEHGRPATVSDVVAWMAMSDDAGEARV